MATAKEKAKPRGKGSVANKAPETHKAQSRKRGAALSIPMVKMNAGDSYNLEIEGVRTQMLPGGNAKTQAVLLRSINLDTGEQMDLIAPSVLCSTLERAYGSLPEFDDKSKEPTIFESTAWDGKKIEVEASKREGKRYMDVNVWEIE